MLETKYDSAFITISFDKDKSFLKTEWKPIDFMEDEEVLNELKELIMTVNTCNPRFNLTDESKKSFGYTPALQAKISQFVIENHNNGFESKSAIVSSKDLMAQVSLEQLNDENIANTKIESMNFFPTEEEAMKWLFGE